MTFKCCINCPNRTIGCHDVCPDYQAEKIVAKWEHEARMKDKSDNADVNAFKYERIAASTGRKSRRV